MAFRGYYVIATGSLLRGRAGRFRMPQQSLMRALETLCSTRCAFDELVGRRSGFPEELLEHLGRAAPPFRLQLP